jgi:hypothetical protein
VVSALNHKMMSFSMDKISLVGALLFVLGGLIIGIRLLGIFDTFPVPLGILVGIIGFIMFSYPNTLAPSYESKILIKESLLNIEAMLESFDASEQCFYLPPKAGKIYVYVPLSPDVSQSEAWSAMEVPLQTVTEVNNKPGLILFTPFSFILKSFTKNTPINEVLSKILVKQFEVADSVRAVKTGDEMSVEISQPLFMPDLPRCEQVFGSFSSFLAGCILSAQMNKPIILVTKDLKDHILRCNFKVPEFE